jgi:hypothetical protein
MTCAVLTIYSEYIPVAIDLLQAQKASVYAEEAVTRTMEQTYKAAFDRIQSSSGLRRAVEIDLRKCVPSCWVSILN